MKDMILCKNCQEFEEGDNRASGGVVCVVSGSVSWWIVQIACL